MKGIATAFAILSAACITTQAQAHHRGHYHHSRHYSHHTGHSHQHYSDGRPSAWCGWFMRHLEGVGDAALDLAANWAHWGHATTPHPGAVVAYQHHVAKIVGPCHDGGCEMISGNDGHAIRTRWRRLAGNIGIREP